MNFKEYQELAKRTAKYPEIGASFVYPMLGLAGEAGEAANKVKKIFRDDGGVLKDERKEEIKNELGDLLWYISQLATELDMSLDDIASFNIEKLSLRLENNTIKGDGDNR